MKRVDFLFTVFLAVVIIVLIHSMSEAADLKKVEKIIRVSRADILYVSLKIDAGELIVHKNSEPDQVLISVQYDDEKDQIDIDFDENKNELFVSLDRGRWFKSGDDHRAPKLEISLPVEIIIELNSKIKAGEIDFNLESLSIKEFELDNFAGQVRVDFPKPNNIEMDILDVHVKVGQTRLRRLGNARFHRAKINGGIGELDIDFTGEGLKSSRAEIDLDIGETSVSFPRELGVRFESSTFGFLTQSNIDYEFDKKGRFYYSENYDSASRTMNVSISSGIGDLRVAYR